MNFISVNIPTRKSLYKETRDFYIKNLNFLPRNENEYMLVNESYPCVALYLQQHKKNKQTTETQLTFHIEKNLPSFCKRLRDFGIEVEVVTDMCGNQYSASFNDPSDNLIYIYCDTLEDENNETVDTLTID
jgi:hypothetical protein